MEEFSVLLLRLRDKKTRGFKKDGLLTQLFKEIELAAAEGEGGIEPGDDDDDEEEVEVEVKVGDMTIRESRDQELGLSIVEMGPLGANRIKVSSLHTCIIHTYIHTLPC